MRFFEVDKIVRDNLPNHRLYDWRQIEDMREHLARYGMALSGVRAELFEAKQAAPTKLIDALQAYRSELRAEKRYDVSDRIRDILTEFEVDTQDEST